MFLTARGEAMFNQLWLMLINNKAQLPNNSEARLYISGIILYLTNFWGIYL